MGRQPMGVRSYQMAYPSQIGLIKKYLYRVIDVLNQIGHFFAMEK